MKALCTGRNVSAPVVAVAARASVRQPVGARGLDSTDAVLVRCAFDVYAG